MTYSIEFKPSAQRQLARLHKAIVPKLQAKIDAFTENPRPNVQKTNIQNPPYP